MIDVPLFKLRVLYRNNRTLRHDVDQRRPVGHIVISGRTGQRIHSPSPLQELPNVVLPLRIWISQCMRFIYNQCTAGWNPQISTNCSWQRHDLNIRTSLLVLGNLFFEIRNKWCRNQCRCWFSERIRNCNRSQCLSSPCAMRQNQIITQCFDQRTFLMWLKRCFDLCPLLHVSSPVVSFVSRYYNIATEFSDFTCHIK